MLKYVFKRILQLIPIFFAVSIVIFLMVRMSPTDPVTIILGGKQTTPEAIAAIKEKFSLDKPLLAQYLIWIKGVFVGNFGTSYKFQQPVTDMIGSRVPVTLGLVVLSSVIGIVVAIPVGVICAVKKNTILDRVLSVISIILVSCPVFLVGILMIMVMSHIHGANFTGSYNNFGEYIQRIIVPSIALSFGMIALTSRVTRSSMIKELKSNYVMMSVSKGLKPGRITFVHALKNALIPVITVTSIQVGAMIVGSVLVENVFALPGLGSLLITGINTSDYPIVQSVTLLLVAAFLLINFLVDIIYALIDPRIKYS